MAISTGGSVPAGRSAAPSARRPRGSPTFVTADLRRRRGAVVEIRERHSGNRPAEGALDPSQVAFVLWRHERDRLALRLHARRPPDPVHVVRGDGRDVVVDHVGDALYVDAASRDIGRDQDLVPSAPEAREGGLPLTLAPVPVDPGDVETGLADLTGHTVCAP